MKELISASLLIALLSCAESGVDNTDQDSNENQTTSSLTLDDFYGNWQIAVEKEGDWRHIKGCDTYGVNISKDDSGEHLALITQSDRMGMSVDL